MWRDTMLAVRIGPFDARVLVTSVFWLAHMRWWTFAVALAGAVVFSALGWLGLSLPAQRAHQRRAHRCQCPGHPGELDV
jgi:intracellular multiplication protein IcmT